MKIDEQYKLESDPLNIILLERHTITGTGRGRKSSKEIGTEYWTPMAYFSNPQNALDYLVNHEIKGTGMKDLETITAKINELHATIQRLTINQTTPNK